VTIILIAGAAGYSYWKNLNADIILMPDINPASNPLEKKPDINPVSKTNPFKDMKTNPFE
jgi:hypothetical protein